jgi:hypothetical protein
LRLCVKSLQQLFRDPRRVKFSRILRENHASNGRLPTDKPRFEGELEMAWVMPVFGGNRQTRMKTKIAMLMAAAFCGWFTAVNSTSAQTWTQTSAPTNDWSSIASSADGTKLVAGIDKGGIYTSTNSGSTWTLTSVPTTNMWTSVASSADGTILAATCVGPGIYVSTNSGATWMHPVNTTGYWNSVALSADGRKIVAVGEMFNYTNVIFSSTNFGLTWTSNSPPNQDMLWAIASSADGSKLVVVVANGGPIYTSTNSGATWILTTAPIKGWEYVASSADGTILGAMANDGSIYCSANSGAIWRSNSIPAQFWKSIASSADGTKLAAAAYYSPLIYTSTNSGITWMATSISSAKYNGISVASSADGSKLIAVNYGSGIWISQTTPSPKLNFALSATNLMLSWTVPSTNFVMQQSSDLSSWSDVTNPPVLNLTNLQNEVILSPNGSSDFYRLKTP